METKMTIQEEVKREIYTTWEKSDKSTKVIFHEGECGAKPKAYYNPNPKPPQIEFFIEQMVRNMEYWKKKYAHADKMSSVRMITGHEIGHSMDDTFVTNGNKVIEYKKQAYACLYKNKQKKALFYIKKAEKLEMEYEEKAWDTSEGFLTEQDSIGFFREIKRESLRSYKTYYQHLKERVVTLGEFIDWLQHSSIQTLTKFFHFKVDFEERGKTYFTLDQETKHLYMYVRNITDLYDGVQNDIEYIAKVQYEFFKVFIHTISYDSILKRLIAEKQYEQMQSIASQNYEEYEVLLTKEFNMHIASIEKKYNVMCSYISEKHKAAFRRFMYSDLEQEIIIKRVEQKRFLQEIIPKGKEKDEHAERIGESVGS